MKDIYSCINEKFSKAGLSVSDSQVLKFAKYYSLLIQENAKYNITTITDIDQVVTKHFLDSLLFLKGNLAMPLFDGIDGSIACSVIDVGTGGGFPGVPLKIMYPDIYITLLDSNSKKMKFLELLCDELELDNVTFVNSRAEDLARSDSYREQFDLCVSRAVANLSTLSEYCIPFIKINGFFLAYKSDNADTEIQNSYNSIKTLGAEVISDNVYELETAVYRRLLLIKKITATDARYPRRNGIPSKRPL